MIEPKLAPTAPAPTSSIEQGSAGPSKHPKERTVGFDRTTDGTGTSILQSALRRQQKRMEKEEGEAWRNMHRDATRKRSKEDKSVANVDYLESLHKRAKRKRQKDKDSAEVLPPHDLPPKDIPPRDRPPDPPPPFRDKKQHGGEEKSNRGAEKSREKSRLVTGPHETVPPRSTMQSKGESRS